MRLWPRKRGAAGETRSAEAPQPIRTEETARALAAARSAAAELHEARRVRGKIDRRADEIERETSKNGFAPLIRQAFGSGS
jgi:hypothetical protein